MQSIKSYFGGKVRTRVSGLCFMDDKILLVKHNMDGQAFFAPPGGGVEFGETMSAALKREFKEETNLEVEVGKQLFTTEYINLPLHAIEIFYEIDLWHGNLKLGNDPEIENNVSIVDIRFFSADELKQMGNQHLHHVFGSCSDPRELLAFSGFFST